jgi:hypothetical protein
MQLLSPLLRPFLFPDLVAPLGVDAWASQSLPTDRLKARNEFGGRRERWEEEEKEEEEDISKDIISIFNVVERDCFRCQRWRWRRRRRRRWRWR